MVSKPREDSKAFLRIYPELSEEQKKDIARSLRKDSPNAIFEKLARDASEIVRRRVAANPNVPDYVRIWLENDESNQVKREALKTRAFQLEIKIADLVELREYGEKACAIRLKGLGAKAMIAVGGVLSGAGALFTVLGTDYMLKGSSAAASSGIAMNPHSGYAFTALIGSLSIAMGAPLACKVNSLLKATGKALTEYKEPLRRLKEWDKASRSLHDEAHRLNKQAMRTIEMALHKETDWDKVAELDYKIDMVNDQIAERAIIAAEASKRL